MFAFKLWGHFGVFRDPITITQNITMPIPPKTTVGGIIAAILGIDYNEYFNDPDYFNFEYSIVLNRSIRKKSFSQNYIEDYTKKSEGKHSAFVSFYNSKLDRKLLFEEQREISSKLELSKKELKKVESLNKKLKLNELDLNKKLDAINKSVLIKMTKAKPICRELLLDPDYTVFINNYKHEDKITSIMGKHNSFFQLYMGNSEFHANYEFIECMSYEKQFLTSIDSFTSNFDKIDFGADNKYTTMYSATSVIGNREYKDYRKIVLGDFNKPILFKDPVAGYNIKLSTGEYNCEFI